jgi:hypothetical protein
MDQAIYERWWPLHLRAARGQSLSNQERAFYDAGVQQFDAEERLTISQTQLQRAREAAAASKAELDGLIARREQLQASLAALEAAIAEESRRGRNAEE